MASTASTSAAAAHTADTPRPAAGPLPRKIGELGYSGQLDEEEEEATEPAAEEMREVDLADGRSASTSTATLPTTSSSTPGSSSSNLVAASSDAASTTGTSKRKRCFFDRLRPSKATYGLNPISVIRLSTLLAVLGATLGAWVLAIQHLNKAQSPSPSTSTSTNGDSESTSIPTSVQAAGAMYIFVNVCLAVVTIIELIFIERAIFQLRAERWAFLHPGQALPQHRGAHSAPGMGIAPWNRPSLPSYAAALGHRGTGDVEDDVIAVPPPPAYGNTRGSTLLLASLLRNSLRRASQQPRQSVAEAPASRPLSYITSEREEEVRSDAERARQLEMALARLEEGAAGASASSS